LHPVETSHVWCVFYFRAMQNFHDLLGRRARAAPATRRFLLLSADWQGGALIGRGRDDWRAAR
jgi:hypothetical protein